MIVTAAPTDGPVAGKLQARDVIFSIGSIAVNEVREALRVVSAHHAGEAIAIEFMRNGQRQQVSVVLDNGWQDSGHKKADAYDGVLGMDIEMWPENISQRGRFDSPVITKVHSLGPAHHAHISSSQRNLAYRGPMPIQYQFDVKTISGLVYNGAYHPIADLDTLDRYATRASDDEAPLLLEIQLWGRREQSNIGAALEHLNTDFFKLQPRGSTSVQSPPASSDDETLVRRADHADVESQSEQGDTVRSANSRLSLADAN